MLIKSGKDIIEIREDIRKKVSEFFNDHLEKSMKQMGPLSIQRFTELFGVQFPEKEASKKNVSDFISAIVASFIVFNKIKTMPRDTYDLCKWMDGSLDDDIKEPF